MEALSKSKVGISVHCEVCGLNKCPRGRSAPMIPMCNFECKGYAQEPFAGDLWPGESEANFGYPCSNKATREKLL